METNRAETRRPAGVDKEPKYHQIDSSNSWDPKVARVRQALSAFLALEHARPASPLEQLHAVSGALHNFAAAVSACGEQQPARELLQPYLDGVRALHARSPFIARLQKWPRGYPGDFETIEWLCDAINRAPLGTIEWALEAGSLHSPIAQQHRNKIGLQARAMLSTLQIKPDARIVSLGCGGCRDLSMIQDYLAPGQGRFVLVDGDVDALEFARTRLRTIASRCEFVVGTVPRVLGRLSRDWQADLVVAGGLFDYLSERWAVATLRGIARILAPDGRVLLSNIATGNPYRAWLDYLGDWRLIERDEQEIERLLAESGFSAADTRLFRDTTGLALMVDVRR